MECNREENKVIDLTYYHIIFHTISPIVSCGKMRSSLNICGAIFSSPISVGLVKRFEKEFYERLSNAIGSFKKLGVLCEEVKDAIRDCDVLVGLAGTGGIEHIVLSAAKYVKGVILAYHKYLNSLPATLEVLPALKARDIMVKPVPYTEVFETEIKRVLKIMKTIIRFKNARLGLIGGPSPWLVYSNVDKDHVKRRLGSEIINISIEELIEALNKVIVDDKEVINIVKNAGKIWVEDSEVKKALRVYKALEYLIKKYELDALTLKCFDLIPKTGTTACIALSLLNTKNFVAACEGDIPLMLTMALLTWLTDKPAFMANVSWVSDDSILLAHCTAPLTHPYELYTHFESKKGVGVRVMYPERASATIARLSADLSTIRLGVGTIVPVEWSNQLCRTQVRIKVNNPQKVIDESIGNHYALVVGDYEKEVIEAAKLLNLKVDLI